MKQTPIALALILALPGCSKGEPAAAPASQAAAEPAAAPAAAAPTPVVAGMDKARLANPCLLDAAAVGAALGFKIDKTEPETMGDMFGCTYRGAKGQLRLNMMWSDPVYFDKAVESMRNASPGDKRDVAGDADKAWIQSYAPNLPVLHYYRQNVLVELVPVIDDGGDAKAIEAALIKLPRIP